MNRTYKILTATLIILIIAISASILTSAKETKQTDIKKPQVDIAKITELTGLTVNQIKGMNKIISKQKPNQSTNAWSTGNMHLQFCCIDNLIYSYSEYDSIPLSIEVWDGKLNPWANVSVTVKIYHFNPYHGEWELYSDVTKLTDKQGKVKFGYQIQMQFEEEYGEDQYFMWIYAYYSNTQHTGYAEPFTLINMIDMTP